MDATLLVHAAAWGRLMNVELEVEGGRLRAVRAVASTGYIAGGDARALADLHRHIQHAQEAASPAGRQAAAARLLDHVGGRTDLLLLPQYLRLRAMLFHLALVHWWDEGPTWRGAALLFWRRATAAQIQSSAAWLAEMSAARVLHAEEPATTRLAHLPADVLSDCLLPLLGDVEIERAFGHLS